MLGREPLIQENIAYLRQARELLSNLEDETYGRVVDISPSAVSGHLRHCIEFYQCLLNGMGRKRVDYDARPRDERLESSRVHACESIEELIAGLRALGPSSPGLKVRTGPRAKESWIDSSLDRELLYLAQHTVHHFALIAMLLRFQGIRPHRDFGVAPSTLEYWGRTSDADRGSAALQESVLALGGDTDNADLR